MRNPQVLTHKAPLVEKKPRENLKSRLNTCPLSTCESNTTFTTPTSHLSAIRRSGIPLRTAISMKSSTALASQLMISASHYKPWMSTSNAVSSSLVKSINELRASLSTSITSTNKTTPSLIGGTNKLLVAASSDKSGAVKKTISMNDYASVTIKHNLLPITKFGAHVKCSTVANCSVSGVETAQSLLPPRYVLINSSSLPNSSTSGIAPFKSLKQNENTKESWSAHKTEALHDKVKKKSDQNGVKFLVKSEDISPHFSIAS